MAEIKKTAKTKKAVTKPAKKELKKAELVSEIAPVDQVPEAKIEVETPAKATAKAGKRSTKAVREAEELAAKEARKTTAKEAEETKKEAPKLATKPPRSKLERAGKKFREAAKLVENDKVYSLDEALELATKTSPVKFDATVELHLNLAVDPKQADQNIRDIVVLPGGTGKSVKVAVFAESGDVEKAKKAGAEIAGSDDFLAQLDKEQIDFDILIATPAVMAKLAKYARLLGPKGLMPNPKSGTVTTDVTKAVSEAKTGRVEYRVDSVGIIHLGIGKVSFGAEKLGQNAQAVLASIRANKPASIKGAFVKTSYVTTTMGPSIKTEV